MVYSIMSPDHNTCETRGQVDEGYYLVSKDIINRAVGRVLSSDVMPHLNDLRTCVEENPRGICDFFNDHPQVREALEGVHWVFDPIAVSSVKGSLYRFFGPSYGGPLGDPWDPDSDDRVQEQRVLLWKTVVTFRWDEYPDDVDHARVAMLKYIQQMSGNRWIPEYYDTLDSECSYAPHVIQGLFADRNGSPCDLLMREERTNQVNLAINQWFQEYSNEYHLRVRFLIAELYGMTHLDIAQYHSTSRSNVSRQIAYAKASLRKMLMEAGVTVDVPPTQSAILGMSREELLSMRRSELARRFPRWKDYLSPIGQQVLISFFGLDGDIPTFDLRITAQKIGTSEVNVRTVFSQVMRIIYGFADVAPATADKLLQLRLYQYWDTHRKTISLDPEDERLLDLRFKGGLTYDAIARQTGVSGMTVVRRIKQILNSITRCQESQR